MTILYIYLQNRMNHKIVAQNLKDTKKYTINLILNYFFFVTKSDAKLLNSSCKALNSIWDQFLILYGGREKTTLQLYKITKIDNLLQCIHPHTALNKSGICIVREKSYLSPFFEYIYKTKKIQWFKSHNTYHQHC